jgi:hypothetical protein
VVLSLDKSEYIASDKSIRHLRDVSGKVHSNRRRYLIAHAGEKFADVIFQRKLHSLSPSMIALNDDGPGVSYYSRACTRNTVARGIVAIISRSVRFSPARN